MRCPSFSRPFTLLVLAVVSSLVAVPVGGQVLFDTPIDVKTNGDPRVLATGDFDADGRGDIAVSDEPGRITTLLRRADHFYDAPVSSPCEADVRAIATGDFDGDGRLDLVVGSANGVVEIFGGAGDGRFAPLSRESMSSPVAAIVACDFDGDSILDIAVAEALGAVVVLRGDGAGGFSPVATVDVEPGPAALVASDFDANGEVDLAAANVETDTLSIFLARAPGDFAPARVLPLAELAGGLAAHDMNADGWSDLVVAAGSSVHVLLGGSDGPSEGTAFPSTLGLSRLHVVDANGDGVPDVVGRTGQDVVTLLGSGGGDLGAPIASVITGRNFDSIPTSADHDEIPDLLLSSANLSLVSVVRGDGSGRFATRQTVPTHMGLGRPAVGDFNADGRPDFALLQTGSFPEPGRVGVLLADGAGGFSLPRISSIGPGPGLPLTADVNSDGRSDLLVLRPGVGLEIYLVRGAGELLPSTFVPLSNPIEMVVGDIDLDGLSDAAVLLGGETPGVSLLFGLGLGTLVPRASIPLPRAPMQLHAFDLDGDDDLDFIVPHADLGSATLLLNAGAGEFRTQYAVITDRPMRSAAAGDIDGDGLGDVILGFADETVVHFNDGNLGFAPGRPLATGPIQRIHAVDLDQDLDLDLLLLEDRSCWFAAYENVGRGEFIGPRKFRVFPPEEDEGARCVNPVQTIADHDGDGPVDIIDMARGEVGEERISVIRNTSRDFPDYACRKGNVNAAAGPVTPVLSINLGRGLLGGETLVFDRFDALVFRMSAPPSKRFGPSRFAVYAWRGRPDAGTVTTLPGGMGRSCFPMPLSGGEPRPIAIWNNFLGTEDRLGAPTLPSTPAPSVFLELPRGVRRSTTFFIQGLLADSAAPNGRVAVTNGIEVITR